jgi:hypothetical protein
VVFEESRVEGNDSGDDDTEILHSNDDIEMSRTLPDCSPSTPQGNTSSVSSRCSGSTGKRQNVNLIILEWNFYNSKERN